MNALALLVALVVNDLSHAATPVEAQKHLEQLAPESTLLYVQWSASEAVRKDSKSRFAELMAEPEVLEFMRQTEATLELATQRVQAADKTPGLGSLIQLLTQATQLALDQPTAVYVWGDPVGKGPQGTRAAVVTHAGDKGGDLSNAVKTVMEAVSGNQVKSTEHPRGAFHQLELVPGQLPLVWSAIGDYFVFGLGVSSLEELHSNWGRDRAPAWLRSVKSHAPDMLPVATTYLDLATMRRFVRAMTGQKESFELMIDALGIGNFESLSQVVGLSGEDWLSHTHLRLDGPPEGLLQALSQTELKPRDLSGIPNKPVIAAAFSVDVDSVYTAVMQILQKMQPRASGEIQELVRGMKEGLDLQLREDLLQSLDNNWTVYCGPRGNLLGGWVIRVGLKDRRGPDKLIKTMMEQLEGLGLDSRAPRIHQMAVPGGMLYTLDFPDDDVFVLPSLAITDKQLVFGFFPQAVREHLTADAPRPGWAEQAEVQSMLAENRKTIALVTVDNRRMLEFAYPLLQAGVAMLTAELRGRSPLDISVLPSADVISRHLGIERLTVYFDDSGLHFEQRGDIPIATAGVAALLGGFFATFASGSSPPAISIDRLDPDAP